MRCVDKEYILNVAMYDGTVDSLGKIGELLKHTDLDIYSDLNDEIPILELVDCDGDIQWYVYVGDYVAVDVYEQVTIFDSKTLKDFFEILKEDSNG